MRVPLLPLDEVADYFAERAGQIQGALDGEEPPPRQFSDPTRCALCSAGWCGHYSRCLSDS